jgi:pimeloyl-ACP methyl ester carboxylesterase
VIYNGASNQFAGGFNPGNAPDGGFGGGNCVATRTPVIFVHGNTVNATFLAKPSTNGAPSVYDTLKAAGYNDCELFGITYLSPTEQSAEALNYHTSTKAAMIRDFINAVKAYTGKSKVHILAHSMGVTVALHGITYGNLWGSIDGFVNVAGGLKGLSSCLSVGFANPAFPTCGSQNIFDSNIFGFWPDGAAGASNPRTGTSTSVGFRNEPARRTSVRFFTISGGSADTIVGGDQCKFNAATALKAQINVAVDHLSTFTNTGAIMNTMLTSSCTGTGCCVGYAGTCSNL